MSAGNTLPWPGAQPPDATPQHKGLMRRADKLKLDGLDAPRIALLLNPPRARAYRTAGQAFANVTDTAVRYDTTQYNMAGVLGGALPWAFAVDPGRITVAAGCAGVWQFIGDVRFDRNAAGGRRLVMLRWNRTANIAESEMVPASGGFPTLTIAAEVRLAAGDYVEMYVYQDSGASMTLPFTSGDLPSLSARLVIPD